MKLKKISLFILLFVFFLPFVVHAEDCQSDKVIIKSIERTAKSENVLEKSDPEVSGKQIGLDLKMLEVGDEVEYTMVISNASGEDYELDKNSAMVSSEYINYSFETLDNSNIIKAGETKEVRLRVKYAYKVDESKYVNGVYRDNKDLEVNLSSNKQVEVNPNTGRNYLILLMLVLVILGVSIYLIKNRKYSKLMILILGTMIIIPTSVYAICKCQIKIDSKVEIAKNPTFCVEKEDDTKYFEFIKNMTWEEYYESDFFKDEDWLEDAGLFYNFPEAFRPENSFELRNIEYDYNDRFDMDVPSGKIIQSTLGCYTYRPSEPQ